MWGRCWPARELAPRRRNMKYRNIGKSGQDRSENTTIFNYQKQLLLETTYLSKTIHQVTTVIDVLNLI